MSVTSAADLPADGPVRLGGVQLPAGRRLSGREDDTPLLWATAEPVPRAGRVWQALTELHPETGLVPILLGFLDGGHQGRPWDERELGTRCDLAGADLPDASGLLARQWADWAPSAAELAAEPGAAALIAPFGATFPGLARGQDQELTDAEQARALDVLGAARIGLVPAARPADVLAAIGWEGDVNRNDAPELLPAAMRSWEDRFGAVLVEVGFAHFRMLARRPPRTDSDILAVAAELWSCCDEFWPADQPGSAETVEEIGKLMADIPVWTLWMD